jgi:hypothetical protein
LLLLDQLEISFFKFIIINVTQVFRCPFLSVLDYKDAFYKVMILKLLFFNERILVALDINLKNVFLRHLKSSPAGI